MKKLLILGTGGTIAGLIDEKSNKTQDYTAGVLGVEKLIDEEMKKLAQLSYKQVANIDSCEADEKLWFALKKECEQAFEKDFSGIVITHGSDTLEESAYFLSLCLKCQIPVVLTASMRAFNARGTDAKANLYNASILALKSAYKGVFVCINERIFSPRFVQKEHSMNVESFSGGDFGSLGYVVNDEPHFYAKIHKDELKPLFELRNLKALPRVDIVYAYADDKASLVAKTLVKDGAKGLVIASFASGSLKKEFAKTLQNLQKKA